MRYAMLVIMFMLSSLGVYSQSYTRQGNQFVQTSSASSNASDQKTDFIWVDSKGVKYNIYLSAKGRAYILKTSQKTGKQYKQYLGEKISKSICAELKVAYVESKKK